MLFRSYKFDVYLGKHRTDVSGNGLCYDIVMQLTEPLRKQGNHVFTDNFYTSPPLLRDLKALGLLGCGTAAANRRFFPKVMKTGAAWGKGTHRGDQRWQRIEPDQILALQWKDNKVVSLLSTLHKASDHSWCKRRCKDPNTGRYKVKIIRQPGDVKSYNQCMKGVDQSDQLLSSYTVLKKVKKYWKVFFLHIIDICTVKFLHNLQRLPLKPF